VNAPRLVTGCLAVLFSFLLPLLTGAPPGSSTAPKSTAKSVAPKAAPRKARQRRAVPVSAYRPAQMAPTPERVKEIQQALADRGYQTPVDGVWGKDSTTAMAKFQKDQKIEGTGKLTSMSLIALGLGPRRDPAGVPTQPEKE
jgi:peptidoglycan hydrolase-like protein with peptidoglycan-binding domain